MELYYKVLKTAQETNKRLGYGDRGKEWDKKDKNKYQGDKTDETYRLPNGAKSALPIYYRNKTIHREQTQKGQKQIPRR